MTSDVTTISLDKYGSEGEIVLADPGYKKRKIADAKSMGMTVKYVDGEQQIDMERGYFAVMEKISYYIESAPIKIKGYESLLDLLEMVDNNRRGAGDELMKELVTEVEKIEKGEASPFVKSPEAVTENSE